MSLTTKGVPLLRLLEEGYSVVSQGIFRRTPLTGFAREITVGDPTQNLGVHCPVLVLSCALGDPVG
jgi:hypothetical protein